MSLFARKSQMPRLTFILFIIVNIFFFASCQLKEDGSKKARQLLSRIDSVNSNIDKYGNPFDEYNQKLTKEFAENNRMPLQMQQIDSFTLLYRGYMKSIDHGIQKLIIFQELDTTFKVVKANLAYLQHSRKLWDKMGNHFLKMYKTGWYALTTEEQDAFVTFINELKEDQLLSHQLGDSVNDVSRGFSKKYGFEYVLDSKN
ncbi:MAG: hypothetical protein KF746_24685 [Chitinophagaceae bacterium]|nr:hypothetical protein [Chitinophagaceae bacterium]